MRHPMMSGHCASPSKGSHERCQKMGHGNTANPDKEFVPCPCECHLAETFECECGGTIRLAPHWDPSDAETYVHVDLKRDGRAIGTECH